MNEDVIEYLNRCELLPDCKYIVAVMLGLGNGNFLFEDLLDYADMEKADLSNCLEDLSRFRIVNNRQGTDGVYYFISDMRIISMSEKN